ncbi:transposable element Tcb2 transposase [Trichonephila clavipes]|nr:transposable element Tcb2 transposase [Trichonephila clavipes]
MKPRTCVLGKPRTIGVLFACKSRFSANSDSRRNFIWKEPGTRYPTSEIRESDQFGGSEILVWRGIMLDKHTPLHIFDEGSITTK